MQKDIKFNDIWKDKSDTWNGLSVTLLTKSDVQDYLRACEEHGHTLFKSYDIKKKNVEMIIAVECCDNNLVGGEYMFSILVGKYGIESILWHDTGNVDQVLEDMSSKDFANWDNINKSIVPKDEEE